MEENSQLNPNILKRLQTGVEPDTEGCASPLDAIAKTKEFDKDRLSKLHEMQSRMRQQNTHVAGPQASKEITIAGHRVTKDFFTCITMCIINLNNKKVDKILDEFGFVMQDLDENPIYPRKKIRKKK